MKITFIFVGGMRKAHIRDAVAEYLKRIKRYVPVECVEVKEAFVRAASPGSRSLKKEAETIAGRIKSGDYAVALDERGKPRSSHEFAAFLKDFMSHGASGKRDLAFIVGGAYGLHPSVVSYANAVMSLSAMTLPHEMAQLLLAEQVYRAFTIIRNEPYSH